MNHNDTNTDNWNGWTCDELTPALCPLEKEEGELVVRGLVVHYWMYYRHVKHDTSRNDDRDDSLLLLPIIILHGGPGFPHPYLLPLRQQACRGRTVIFYDQAGCGQSSLNSSLSSHPWLLDPMYYATEELPALIDYLNLTQYHLIGHSWGSMLAQLFALKNGNGNSHDDNDGSGAPQQLASMVLLGPLSDSRLFEQAMWDPDTGNLGRLPPFVQRRIQILEANDRYDSSEYRAINQALTGLFTCRTFPLPDCYQQSQATRNTEIYVAMQGPSEFSNGGVLAHFNTTGQLMPKLSSLPVLLGAGSFDIIRPAVLQVMLEQLPLSEMVLFNKSAHVSAIDEPARTNNAIAAFFDRVEESIQSHTVFVPNRSADDSSDWWWHIVKLDVLVIAVTFLLSVLFGYALAYAIMTRQRRQQGYRSLS